jgi:hypothetical protein
VTSEESQRVFSASRTGATAISFDLARRSLRAAEIQINRIWDRPAVHGDHQSVKAGFQDVLVDVHFYFVALRNVYRFLDKVVSDEAFKELRPGLDELNDKWFKHYTLGRNALEHIDERLPGQRHENRIVEIEEKGAKRKINYGLRLREGLFLHSDLTWDISKATYERIDDDVQALLRQIVEKGGPSNP